MSNHELTGPDICILVLCAVGILVGAYDLYAGFFFPPGGTVSEVILDFARKYPIVPFLMGLLCGHLVWPQR